MQRPDMSDLEGQELLVAGLGHRATLLFELDKLMSELVATGSETNKYITLEPLNAFHRKLVHTMVPIPPPPFTVAVNGVKSSFRAGRAVRTPNRVLLCLLHSVGGMLHVLLRGAGLQAGGHHVDTHRTSVLASLASLPALGQGPTKTVHNHDLCNRASELIGDIYLRLKGKRSRMDTSHGKGTYCYPGKPVWESRRTRWEDDAGEG
jgi:hypothetical protein